MMDDDSFYATAKEIPNVEVQTAMEVSGSNAKSPTGTVKKSSVGTMSKDCCLK